MLYVAWKRGFPRKFARIVLFRPIKKRSFNLLCVLDLWSSRSCLMRHYMTWYCAANLFDLWINISTEPRCLWPRSNEVSLLAGWTVCETEVWVSFLQILLYPFHPTPYGVVWGEGGGEIYLNHSVCLSVRHPVRVSERYLLNCSTICHHLVWLCIFMKRSIM